MLNMYNMERPLGHWDSLCMDRRLGDHFHYCSRRERRPRLQGRCNTLDYCLWRSGEPRTLPMGTRFVNTHFPLENWLIRRALASEIKWPGEPIKRERAPPLENEEPANNETSANNVMARSLPVITCVKSPDPQPKVMEQTEGLEVNNAAASPEEVPVELCRSARSYSDYDLVSSQKPGPEDADLLKEETDLEPIDEDCSQPGFIPLRELYAKISTPTMHEEERAKLDGRADEQDEATVDDAVEKEGDVERPLLADLQVQEPQPSQLESGRQRREGGLVKFFRKISARIRLTPPRSH